MSKTKKNIETALAGLKKQKTRLDKMIRDLANAKTERTQVVAAIGDLEHALKAVRGAGSKKKAAPKPKAKTKATTKAKAKAKRKVAKKKAAKNTAKGWTPAKRAAARRRAKAFWGAKKMADARREKAAKKKPGPKPKAKAKVTKKKTNRSKGGTPAKRAAVAPRVKAYWASKKRAG